MIPCQCSQCIDSSAPYFFKYSRLKNRQETGRKPTIECEISEEDVSLNLLLKGYDIRKIVACLPDTQGEEPTPPALASPTPPSTAQPTPHPATAMPDAIDRRTRIALSQTLSALPPPQFEELLFALNPPRGTISSGAQKTRVSELLNWMTGPGGINLADLLDVLAQLDIPFKLPSGRPNQPPMAAPPPPPMPAPPAPSAKPAMQTIKIFLASSSELKADREQFEIFINRKNSEYIKQGLFLELVLWENFIDAMSQTRLQDEYNTAITACDIFVSLFYSKVGQYTREEFLKAADTFKANGKPLIYTYFKELEIKVTRANRKDFESLFDFQDELSDKGHFYTEYISVEDLKYKFGEQLVKILPQLTNP